jgi:hypothetical protein
MNFSLHHQVTDRLFFFFFFCWQILEHVGSNLEVLDISGGVATSVTDEGLSSVTQHCRKLQELCLSLLRNITCVTLLPLFHDQERANTMRKLYLSCKQVCNAVESVIMVTCL